MTSTTFADVGDPRPAAAIADHLGRMADGLDAAAMGFGKGTVTWSGAAATAFAVLVTVQPTQFATVAGACRSVSRALARHADSLGEAEALLRRADAHRHADPVLATALADQARHVASSSAQTAAHAVRAAADAAPDRPGIVNRLLTRGAELMGELRLGATEATESAARAALSLNQLRLLRDFGAAKDDADAMAGALAGAARHPTDLVRAVVDWDTWTSNPARAAGHLVPDALAAVTTAGAATATRTAVVANREQRALQAARAADARRRTVMEAAATAAREDLVRKAVADGAHRFRPRNAWAGAGGTRLSPEDAGAVETYWFMVAGREARITEMMSELSQESRGVLIGIENRLKGGESFKRKIATQQAALGRPVGDLLARVNDTVRYRIVFAETRYTEGVTQASALLDRRGFHRVDVDNHWHRSTRYRGINSTWIHARTGTVLEVQFHTPQSNLASVLTHGMYERMRLPDTSRSEKAQLGDRIAAVYAGAPKPPGSETLSPSSLPPPTPPRPIVPPPDLTVPAGAAGAAASAGVLAPDRLKHPAVRGAR
jgi:hypothetical protein